MHAGVSSEPTPAGTWVSLHVRPRVCPGNVGCWCCGHACFCLSFGVFGAFPSGRGAPMGLGLGARVCAQAAPGACRAQALLHVRAAASWCV